MFGKSRLKGYKKTVKIGSKQVNLGNGTLAICYWNSEAFLGFIWDWEVRLGEFIALGEALQSSISSTTILFSCTNYFHCLYTDHNSRF